MTGEWGATTSVAAVVTLADGEIVPGQIHLQGAVSQHRGPETPLEMLNRPEGFFPLTFDDGGVCFLSKEQVAMVLCEWPQDDVDQELQASAESIHLHVMLVTGEKFRGRATVVMPAPRRRALDYVNWLRPFFLLETEGGPRLINRAHVRLVRPLD
jgi:hypothetical protein